MSNEQYLDPPLEPESEICEYCGHELVEQRQKYRIGSPDTYCDNKFCPSKFDVGQDTLLIEMSQRLVEVEDSLKTSQSALRFMRNSFSHYRNVVSARDDTISSLERQIIAYQQILNIGQ